MQASETSGKARSANNDPSPVHPPQDKIPAPKIKRGVSLRKLSAYAVGFFGALVLIGASLILVFGGAILDGYGRKKAERAFDQAYPGSVLRIGKLDFSLRANCLVAHSVTLSATNQTLKVDRILLTGVRWIKFLWGNATLVDVLAKATLDATNLDLQFHQAQYSIRCARLQASVPASELIAEGTELRTTVGDAAFFAAHDFRTTRFHVLVPECKVLGLAYGEVLQGKSYRAHSVQCSSPTLEALVDRDKPTAQLLEPRLMVNEALAAIPLPLQIDHLSISNGHLRYCEQLVAGADPGVLTISSVDLSADGIANRGDTSAAILVRAQGRLMDAATLKVVMSIAIAPKDFSLHYTGSLGAMDLTTLDAFLDTAEHIRIKSGAAQEAAFEVDVVAGQAHGHVLAIYTNLQIALLDSQSGSEKGFENYFASFLANMLKIRNSNVPGAPGSMKEGEINYARKPEDVFQQYAWFALRSGVLDVIRQ
jgi:hypothetical protein